MTTLDVHAVVRRPAHTLDVELVARPGDVVAVIGPNGSGKTTLLRALAGLQPLDEGHIRYDETWEDVARGIRLTTQRRHVGMVFQDHLLFPHLDVGRNVAFGPVSRGRSRTESRELARRWLDRVGVLDLIDRRPGELSGGQAQRVSLARALATEPRLLLLDEALAALDVGVAMALRLELAHHLGEFPGVSMLVTHDAIDTMTIANRIVVLDEGRVAQVGTPHEVAQRPRTAHVARLVGLNVLRGVATGTDVRVDDGSLLVTSTPAAGEVCAAFSPSAVTLTREEPVGSARNRWAGVVTSVVPHGAAVRVHLDAGGGLIADVTPGSAAQLSLTPGRPVWAAVKATEVTVYGSAPASGDPLRFGHV